MNGFLATWQFTRGRLAQSWEDLSDTQLHWRSPEGENSIAEILAHIAGCEHFLGKRLLSEDPVASAYDAKLDAGARAVFLNEESCPWSAEELGHDGLSAMLAASAATSERALGEGFEGRQDKEQDSPLGATITGFGAAQRMAQHAGYHTGQIWMLRRHPQFPKS
ncbi:MAG: DinB family protein [Armatimonadetes bacterium]|nr:DinB family protein [Armatimonadota bacterium]